MIYDEFGNLPGCGLPKKRMDENSFFDYISSFSIKKNQENNTKKKLIFQNVLEKKKWIPRTVYRRKNFLKKIISGRKKIRNVSIVGHLHHGKSSLINCLVSNVHSFIDESLSSRFSDFSFFERKEEFSLHISITTLLTCDKNGNSHILALIDNPGHPDFFDQTITSMTFSEGSILVIDLSDGILLGTELSLRYLTYLDLPIILVMNAFDRLVIEIGLSPKRVRKKIIQILDELNSIIQECDSEFYFKKSKKFQFFNPIDNNVCFASLAHGWTFTLDQFSEMYLSSQPSLCCSNKDLTQFLWGNYYPKKNHIGFLNSEYVKNSVFEQFILVPIFKIIFLNMGESSLLLRNFMETELGVFGIKKTELIGKIRKPLEFCMTLFFGGCRDIMLSSNHSGLISSLVNHFPFYHNYQHFTEKTLFFLKKNFSLGFIWNFLPPNESRDMLCVTKILNGRIEKGISISILTEGHSLYWDQNFRSVCSVKNLFLPIGIYNLKVNFASKGTIVLLEGPTKFVKRSAIFSDLRNGGLGFQKIAYSVLKNPLLTQKPGLFSICIETKLPYQKKKLFEFLRNCCRLYTSLQCNIQESGEMLLNGPGEIFLYSILFYLRKIWEKIDFKVSKFFLNLRETILPNQKEFFFSKYIKLKITKYETHHLDFDLKVRLRIHNFCLKKLYIFDQNFKKSLISGFICKTLQKQYKTTKFEANSLWGFGFQFPNFPLCRIIASSRKTNFSENQKKNILEGFQWVVSEGPITEMIFDFTFFHSELKVKEKNNSFPVGIKRFFKYSFFESNLKVQEPWFLGEIIFFRKYLFVISNFIEKKKGLIISYSFKEGKKEIILRFSIPVFATLQIQEELQKITQQKLHPFFFFDSWESCNQKKTGETTNLVQN